MGIMGNRGLDAGMGDFLGAAAEKNRLSLRDHFGLVVTGKPNHHRLQQALDDFKLPRGPVTLPGANTPKPIHPEVAPGPNSCCGDGDWDASTRSCVCKQLFYGPRCQFKKLNKHAHGRYTCPTVCPRGVEQASNGKCICPEGWGGQHCQIPQCLHGRLGCPTGGKFCLKPHCLCTVGWEGPRCGHKPTQKQHRQTNFIIPSLRKLKRSQPHHAMAVICHAKILERSAGRHAVALAYPHTRERFVKNVLNRNVQRVKVQDQIPVVVCARLKSSARIMACSMTTLVVAHAQILGMVNNAKSVPQNRVMVMVYGTTSNALACVMHRGYPIRNARHAVIWNVVHMEHLLKKIAPVDAKATGKVFNATSARQKKSVSLLH